jgi:phage replication O-like protein O
MASPQLEDGYLRIANEIIDALCRYRLPGEEMQCLLVVLRKTYGYGKKEDAISLSQFALITGMKRPNVSRALTGLLSKKILYVIKKDTVKTCIYTFNKDFTSWISVIKKDTTRGVGGIKKDKGGVSKKMHTKDNNTKERKPIPEEVTYQLGSGEILNLEQFFEFLWKSYPRRIDKKAAYRHYKASVKTAEDMEAIDTALGNYLEYLKKNNIDPKYIKHGSTWFNNWQDWKQEA